MVAQPASISGNPRSMIQPAAHKTRCPSCGYFSPFGQVCPPCMETIIAAEKTIANVCPCCRQYSPFGSLCNECVRSLASVERLLAVEAAEPAPMITGAQLVLTAEKDAPVGLCDIEMFIGPDSVAADEVLNPHEYLTAVRHCIAHLESYADAYEAALVAEDGLEYIAF